MRSTRLLAGIILIATCIVGFNSSAWAEEEKDFSPEDMALIKSFTLTTDFLQKWKAMNQDTNVLGCNVYALNLTAETIEDRAKEYDARPGVHASLVSHNLTAREVVLGTTTLAVASLQMLREKFKWMASEDDAPMPVTEANVKFVRDHYDEVSQLDQLVRKNRDARHPKGACPEQ